MEVECQTLDEGIEAAKAGADVVMFDNFSPEVSAFIYSLYKTLTYIIWYQLYFLHQKSGANGHPHAITVRYTPVSKVV